MLKVTCPKCRKDVPFKAEENTVLGKSKLVGMIQFRIKDEEVLCECGVKLKPMSGTLPVFYSTTGSML